MCGVWVDKSATRTVRRGKSEREKEGSSSRRRRSRALIRVLKTDGRTDGRSEPEAASGKARVCVCVLRRPQKRRMRRISQIEIARRARKKAAESEAKGLS